MSKVRVENIESIKNETANTESNSENEIPEPIPEAEAKPIKKQKTISCPSCKREMLEKTYKYYHSLKCKPQTKETIQQIPKPEKIEVSFEAGRPNEINRRLIKTERIQ